MWAIDHTMTAPIPLIITGISSELGQVLARQLGAAASVPIIGTMRRARRKDDDVPAHMLLLDECDLTKPECCAAVASAASRQFSGPFGFIHSVGDYWDHVPFLDVGPAQASQMFDSHVTTFYNVMQAMIPVLQAKGGGSAITFSCNSVKHNYPWMASFTAAKSAVDSLVRSLANEFSGDGMRFNSLVLASLKTTKVQRAKPYGDFANFIPPADLVPIIRFLLSDEAYLINGNAINLFVHSDVFYNAGYFQRVAK